MDSNSVVLWGSNLSPTLGFRYSDKLREMVSLPPYIKSILVGLILTDGPALEKRPPPAPVRSQGLRAGGRLRKTPARLCFKQSFKHIEFALWIYRRRRLAHYCQSLPCLYKGSLNGKVFYGLALKTRAHPCFTLLHYAWYSNGVKVLPSNIFEDLTPIALAVWAQGDGSRHTSGFLLHTQSFTIQQVVLLRNVLSIKFGLNCSIHYDHKMPVIYIRQNSMSTFRALLFSCVPSLARAGPPGRRGGVRPGSFYVI
jgi:hypothetical protein